MQSLVSILKQSASMAPGAPCIATREGTFTIDLDFDQIQIEQFESPTTIASLCHEAIAKKKGGASGA